MQRISTFFVLVLFLSSFALSAKADCGDPDPTKPKYPKSVDALPACSYTTTNNSCKVTIDRMNPSTPPTIYVRQDCKVYVVVHNVYLLERLTLDWKSSTIVVPTDTFQRAFTALSPNLGAITVLGGGRVALLPCENSLAGCATAQEISEAQKRLANDADIQPYTTIKPQIAEIKRALPPPPGGTPISHLRIFGLRLYRCGSVVAPGHKGVPGVGNAQVYVQTLLRQESISRKIARRLFRIVAATVIELS